MLWIATTIVPHHHHHDGIIVFGLNITHADCHEDSCSNSEDEENCCNNNDCEECPFLKGNDSIITKGDNNDDEKIKISLEEEFDIEDYKYSYSYVGYVKYLSRDYVIKTILLSQSRDLRAPPFA